MLNITVSQLHLHLLPGLRQWEIFACTYVGSLCCGLACSVVQTMQLSSLCKYVSFIRPPGLAVVQVFQLEKFGLVYFESWKHRWWIHITQALMCTTVASKHHDTNKMRQVSFSSSASLLRASLSLAHLWSEMNIKLRGTELQWDVQIPREVQCWMQVERVWHCDLCVDALSQAILAANMQLKVEAGSSDCLLQVCVLRQADSLSKVHSCSQKDRHCLTRI